jgi:glyoxylase-like metal-dependent hydrolase (beta-lactamase superfamily II)
MVMKNYAIYALRYAGPLQKCGAHFLWQRDWDKTRAGNFYLWCIRNEDQIIVVDTGTSPELAEQKKLPNYVSPVRLLADLGIKAREIQHVVLSHLHWDHAGGIGLFPNATYYLHHKEYAFWARDKITLTPSFQWLCDQASIRYLKKAEEQRKLVLIKKERQILPGVRTILAPGHSPGLMAVAVNTLKGTAVIGSDAAYIMDNYQDKWPGDVIFNLADTIKSLEKLQKKASAPGLLYPGHDTNLADDYPKVAENITRLA